MCVRFAICGIPYIVAKFSSSRIIVPRKKLYLTVYFPSSTGLVLILEHPSSTNYLLFTANPPQLARSMARLAQERLVDSFSDHFLCPQTTLVHARVVFAFTGLQSD